MNYHIHTDAIKADLIPAAVTPKQVTITYANEADILDAVLFGTTAKQWQDTNPKLEGNMRRTFSDIAGHSSASGALTGYTVP